MIPFLEKAFDTCDLQPVSDVLEMWGRILERPKTAASKNIR